MEISWLGHSCFKIKGKEITLVTDPFSESLGYSPAKLAAGIVTVSHSHQGHSYTSAVSGSPRVINRPGEYEISHVFISGISTFHDSQQGKDRGKNIAYLIEIEDVKLCHLGDLGHKLSPHQVEQLSHAEVLLLPVGGVSTVDAHEAAEIVRLLSPRIVIPMHYKTEVATWLQPVEGFITEMGAKQVTPQPKLSVTRNNLPPDTTVIVLDYH